MKLVTLATLLLLLFAPNCLAQAEGALRIGGVGPYPKAAPGQIMELRVEGIGEQLFAPPPGDALRILLRQDGGTRRVRARTAAPGMMRQTVPGAAGPGGMQTFQGITFVVPRS